MTMLDTHGDYCPYCGERIELLIDPSTAGQDYIEDCQVCCRPINVSVWLDEQDEMAIGLAAEDD